jgi:two-component system chemotaxis response regulator CheB
MSKSTAPSRHTHRRDITVLIVDDSAVAREVLTRILTVDPRMTVSVAADPLIAMQKMRRRRPDVIVLDLDMPRMDGLSFLRRIMAEDPIPVVVCSALATKAPMVALDCGAVEVIQKPRVGLRDFLEESARSVRQAVHGAAQARLRSRGVPPAAPRVSHVVSALFSPEIVAIGASTGGTDAVRNILQAMPPGAPPILVVQHMPELFTAQFAARLDECCGIEVKEAEDGDRLQEGHAFIAPGNTHLRVRRRAGLVVELWQGPMESGHRPSVDVLFRSVAEAVGPSAVGVLLTGMGSDGAAGMLAMRRAGGRTIVQDEATCVVFGMPKEAIARGAVDHVVPLQRIPSVILGAKGRSHGQGLRRD